MVIRAGLLIALTAACARERPTDAVIASRSSALSFATGLRSLVARRLHSCAILADSTVVCWGFNSSGQLGADPSQGFSAAPVHVPGLSGVASLAAGEWHTCARLNDGTVRCWGDNRWGQLGNGVVDPNPSPTPVIVQGLSGVSEVAAGERHTCALVGGRTSPGSVTCWGANDLGELGTGDNIASPTPVQVQGLTAPIALAAGYHHSCVIQSGGSGVWCWGSNASGELGNGILQDSFNLPQVAVNVANPMSLAIGGVHTCALQGNGSVRCWGANLGGSLGVGDLDPRPTPTTVGGVNFANGLWAGDFHTCARIINGQVLCWGRNDKGQLHDGTTTDQLHPVPMLDVAGLLAMTGGQQHTCVRLADGNIRCWGTNEVGILGDSSLLLDAAEGQNLAFNPSCPSGFPSPAESDNGWGGGSNKCEIVDGLHSYDYWAHGLAFTGGHATGAGGPPYIEVAGPRHAVIDFGAPKTFQRVVIWWHGPEYTPDAGSLEVWDGAAWVPIPDVHRTYGTLQEAGSGSGSSESDSYTFAPVTGSKVRYTFDNSGHNIVGTWDIHGWIYEVEVWTGPGPADAGVPDGGTGADGGPPPGAANGVPCVLAGECASGHCTDGVCCPSACGDGNPNDCQACSVAAGGAADGTCGPLAAGATCYTRANFCDATEPTLSCDGAAVSCPSPTSWGANGCLSVAAGQVNLLGGLTVAGGVRIQFASAWSGKVAVREGFGCPPPDGFEFVRSGSSGAGHYWDFLTEPSFGYPQPIKVCVKYDQQWVQVLGGSEGGTIEKSLALVHGTSDPEFPTICNPQGAGWSNITVAADTPSQGTLVDMTNNIVCGRTSSMSPFALVAPGPLAMQFVQPINADGSSIFKAGSTIPVKFQLTGASAGITTVVGRVLVARVSTGVTGSYVETVSNAAPDSGNLFRYDATSGQYIYNLSTKGMATGTWSIRADLGDGADHAVIVSLK